MTNEQLQTAIEFAASQLNSEATTTYVRASLERLLTALVIEQADRAKIRQ
jgi:hypothetical protein